MSWLIRLGLVACGLAAAFAFPPWGLLPGILGYAGMFWGVDASLSWRQAFFRAWLTGVGFFAISLAWIWEPFQVDAATYGWIAPFAVVLIVLIMSAFWGASAAVWRVLAGERFRGLLFAGIFSLGEWLRGHAFTGFPWNLPGTTWPLGNWGLWPLDAVGAYGLTFITIAAVVDLAPALERRRFWWGVLPLGLLTLEAFAPDPTSHIPRQGPAIRLVQADVVQASKDDPNSFVPIFQRYIGLTIRPAAQPPDVVIWPEGAIEALADDYLAEGTWTRQALLEALEPGQILIVGVAHRGPPQEPGDRLYEGLWVLKRTETGLDHIATYDKHHLVPFGEYMPYPKLAGAVGFKQLVKMGDGFTAGPPPTPRRIPGLPPVQFLICYESLFPGIAHGSGRAAWIANLSDDGWFGTGPGPVQLLHASAYRAAEEGLPMLRANPVGITAVVDARGRIVRQLPLGAADVIDFHLPPALPPALYSRFGEAPFFAMVLFSLIGVRRRWR
jgi:apolipoprotein N-acyltransferase